MSILLKAAFEYRRAGISIVGITEGKRSFPRTWGKYQYQFMTETKLIEVFNNPMVCGIAIICGDISGKLEVLDFDCKNDLTKSMFNEYSQILNTINPELFKKLVVAFTKNEGYHFIYRCSEIESNTVLARRLCTDIEKMNNPNEKIKVLIETRGKGGYAIVHPTMGYRFIQHDLKNIPLIEPEQRSLLFNIARSFNLYQDPEPDKPYPASVYYDPESPFDDYNNRGNVIELLQKHGWKVVRRTSVKTYFLRPGNTDHDTSGDFNHELGLFGVFSTSTEFKRQKGYKPYQVYTILECNGNFKLAAKRLLAEGYGIPYKARY